MPATSKLRNAVVLAIFIAVAPVAVAQEQAYDPPDRVVRLSYQTGDVEYAAAGSDDWGLIDINRVLMPGDRIGNGDDAMSELDLGTASVRIDRDSAFSLVNLDDQLAQFQLAQGTLDLRVRRMGQSDTYEVDTPTLAFVADTAGNYRVDIGADGSTTITVYSGSGTVYGDGGVSEQLQAGAAYQFGDSQLQDASAYDIAPPDDFDRFCAARDARYERMRSRRYVSPYMIGAADLDDYGQWSPTPEYGAVWYPNRVPAGWAPYHDGHWIWVDPWGWTWVDNAPWGFAPSHYGRWAWIGGRWGWIPGPATAQPVYAPALVAFVGGSGFSLSINLGGGGGQPVGWFPLGPRDVYQPPYQVTKNYFNTVNVTNVKVINTTVINNVYINNYNTTRPTATVTYANMKVPGAMTVVPRAAFTSAKPVAAAAIAVQPSLLARAVVTPAVRIAPVAASIGVAASSRPSVAAAHAFSRPVLARTPPPAPPAPFAARAKAIASQGGAPLAASQLRHIDQQHAAGRPMPHIIVAAPPHGAAPVGISPPAPVKRLGVPPPVAPNAGERPSSGRNFMVPVERRNPTMRPSGPVGDSARPALDRTPPPHVPVASPVRIQNPPATPQPRPIERGQETRSDVRPPVAPISRPELRPAPRPEVQPISRPELRPAPHPEAQPISRPELRPAPRPEVQPMPRPDPRPVPRPEQAAPPIQHPPIVREPVQQRALRPAERAPAAPVMQHPRSEPAPARDVKPKKDEKDHAASNGEDQR